MPKHSQRIAIGPLNVQAEQIPVGSGVFSMFHQARLVVRTLFVIGAQATPVRVVTV